MDGNIYFVVKGLVSHVKTGVNGPKRITRRQNLDETLQALQERVQREVTALQTGVSYYCLRASSVVDDLLLFGMGVGLSAEFALSSLSLCLACVLRPRRCRALLLRVQRKRLPKLLPRLNRHQRASPRPLACAQCVSTARKGSRRHRQQSRCRHRHHQSAEPVPAVQRTRQAVSQAA